jgi:hypothetical protein
MSELAVIVDMDMMAFPSGKFIEDVSQALEDGFGIDAKSFSERVPGLHVQGVGNLRHYDFFAHIESLGLSPDEVEQYILSTFSDRDYVYGDVAPFLDFLANEAQPNNSTLLTYGETRFQRLKYDCAPTLGSLSFVDTLLPKGRHITEHFSGQHGVIIDDKIVDNLPLGFKHVWVNRALAPPSGAHRTLQTVQEQWGEILNDLPS